MRLLPLSNGQYAQVSDEDFFPCLQYIPWHVATNGYVVTQSGKGKERRQLRLHKFIQERMGLLGDFDHKDRNKLNSQRDNLRPCTRSQNQANRKVSSLSQTGVKGVRLRPNGWYQAEIRLSGIKTSLGYFRTIEAAKETYDAASLKEYGEFHRP